MQLDYDWTRRVLFVPTSDETWMIRDVFSQCRCRWNKDLRRWEVPCDLEMVEALAADIRLRGTHLERTEVVADWELAELQRVAFLKANRDPKLDRMWEIPAMRPPSKTEPRHHQVSGSRWLYGAPFCFLTDDMGLGKTKEAIDAAVYLHGRSEISRVIVACPNSLKYNWRDEIEKHSAVINQRIELLEGITAKRRMCLVDAMRWDSLTWVILNYESLRLLCDWKTVEYMVGGKKKTKKVIDTKAHSPLLDATFGSILICDEAHRLKDGRSQVSTVVKACSPSRIWLLTGTPIANNIKDLWSLTDVVRPGLLGFSYYQFEARHLILDRFGGVKGYQDVDHIAKKFWTIALGRRKEDCIDLPPKTWERRDVELSPAEWRAYTQMRDSMRAWIETEIGDREPVIAEAQTFAARLVRLRQIADGLVSEGAQGAQAWSKDLSKIRAAVEVWEDAGRPPMVVWCQWVPVIQGASLEFGRGDGWAHAISGGVSLADRHRLINLWNNHDHGVLICQMDTAGEGLNLHHASLQVFIDAPWTPKQRLQCVDRLHRIGQQNPVTIVDIVGRKTVDGVILKRLEKKIEAAREATGVSYDIVPKLSEWKELLA